MEYKTIVTSAKEGNLQNAINILKGYQEVLENEKYINIMVFVCRTCAHSNASSNFTGKEVVELVNLCLSNVQNPGETEISQFLSASYHILKYLLEKNEVELIHKNPGIWNPSFLSNCLNDHFVVFKNQCVLLCQNIISFHKNKKNTDCDIEKLCMLLMQMIDRLPLPEDFSQKDPYVMLNRFFYLTLRPAFVEQIYKYQFVKIFNNQPMQQLGLKFLMDGLIIITIKFIETEEHERAAYLIQSVIEQLKTKFTGDVYHFLSASKLLSELLIKNNLQPINLLNTLQLIDASLKTCKSSNTEIPQFYKLFKVILIEFHKYHANVEMETASIRQLFEILLYMGRKANVKFTDTEKCSTCTNCGATLDFRNNISFLQLITHIFRHYSPTVSMTEHLLDIVDNTFTCLFNLIDEFRGCCESWTKHWRDTMTCLYNTAVSLYRLKSYQNRLIWLGKLFLKQYFARWNKTVVKSMIQSSTLHALLNMLCTTLYETKQLQYALQYCAFNVFMCDKKDTENCFCCSQWIQMKKENKQTCSNITMVSVLTDTFWHKIIEDFKFTNEQKLALLNVELQVYQTGWPSRIPMGTCCLEIHKFGSLTLAVQSLVYAWIPNDDIPSEINDIISKSRQEYESMNLTVEQKLDLASLYFLEYRTRIKAARLKIEKSMVNEPPESNSQNYLYSQEVQYNKLDCMSNYEELYLLNHEKNLELLIKSLKIFKNVLRNTNRDLLMKKNIYMILMSITHTLDLQGYSIYYLKGMLLSMKVAEIINNNISIVETIGYVLEISNVNSDDFKALLRRAEDIIETIIGGVENQDKSTVVIYYVHKANAFLRYGLIETAKMAYENAKQLHSAMGVSDTLADIKLRFLTFNLKTLPCHCNIENHSENVLSEPNAMLQNLMDSGKAISNNSCTNPLYMNILMSCLVRYYRWTDQVRELRCYGKSALTLAKQHVLPLRAGQILDHLIAGDLMGERWDDYQVKLNGLTAILNVSAEIMEEGRPIAKTPVENNICSLVDNFKEMALDIPSIPYQSDFGSPVLSSSCFKMPDFIYHDEDCTCFPCMSVEYQNLTLIEVVSKANLWASRDNALAAKKFFKGGIQLYKSLIRRQEIYQKKVIKCIKLDLYPTLEDLFAETYTTLLFEYGDMLFGTSRFLAISDELITVLEKNIYRNIQLYLKSLSQRINHLSLNQTTKLPMRLSPIPSTTGNIGSRSNTPENRMSTVAVVASISPKPKSKRIIRKAIKFDLSDNDESNERKKSSSRSPLFNIPKTPATTSKIRVYKPKSIKQAKPVVKSSVISDSKLPTASSTSTRVPVPEVVITSPDDEAVSLTPVIKEDATESGPSRCTGVIRRSARRKK